MLRRGARSVRPGRRRSPPEAARTVLTVLRLRGASFFRDLAPACGFDAEQLSHALGALVACGLVASDGFAGVRALVWAARPAGSARSAPHLCRPLDGVRRRAGRGPSRGDAIELQARAFLRRYGVVFRRLLTREATRRPGASCASLSRLGPGRDRGGRFATGCSGEQFAFPHAVERLREIRRQPAEGSVLTISAADPLNLPGLSPPASGYARRRAAASSIATARRSLWPKATGCAKWCRSIPAWPPTLPIR